jgi:hypothetical protein
VWEWPWFLKDEDDDYVAQGAMQKVAANLDAAGAAAPEDTPLQATHTTTKHTHANGQAQKTAPPPERRQHTLPLPSLPLRDFPSASCICATAFWKLSSL